MTAEKFKVLLGAALFVVQASACRAQVPVRWFAESSRPTKQIVAVYQGETILLQPTMQSYGAPITNVISATLYWQTNNMEQAWWTKPTEIIDGQITAIFHPTNDFGAREYTFFIGSTAGLGTSYRAFGTLKMQSAPGFLPAVASTPVLWPSMATDLLPSLLPLLPEYDPLGSALAVSQSLAQVIADLPTGGGGTATNISLAAAAAIGDFAGTETIGPLRVNAKNFGRSAGDSASGTDYFAVGVEAGSYASGNFWSAIGRGAGVDSHGNSWSAIGNYAGYETSGNAWTAVGQYSGMWGTWTNSVAVGRYSGHMAKGNNRMYMDVYADEPDEESEWVPAHSPTNDAIFIDSGVLNLGRSGQLAPTTPNRLRGEWQLDDGTRLNQLAESVAVPTLRGVVAAGNHTATNVPAFDDEAVVSVRAEEAERIALYGSATVRPGVEAYSTYAPALIARSATGPGALLIQGPVSNSVAAEISGELLISSEPTANEGAGQPGAIRLGGRAITSWDEIEAQIDQSDINALNAWGRRLPDGTPNAASNTAVVINTPMIIASGLGFETSGNYAVCITAGAEMQVVTNGGWVCIKPSTWTDGIGFRTVSMTVPAIANSFNVVNGGKTNGYAQIKFAYTAGETNAPPVSYSTDLLTWAFAPEQEATQDGAAWTVTVAADQPRMYFKGEGRTGSADRIYSAYPHTFDQGIAVGGLVPVVYDAVITVEHGGKTYRIPAQEVQ